jgi:hypothetical protein
VYYVLGVDVLDGGEQLGKEKAGNFFGDYFSSGAL